MTAMLAAALRYAARSWAVFPCHAAPGGICTCGDPLCCWPTNNNAGKHPRTARGYLDATTDPAVIRRWWRQWPTANIGLACEPSGLLALDVDRHGDGPDGEATLRRLRRDLGELPPTVAAATGGGGWHLLHRLPAGELRGSLGGGVDIKVRGYIIAPPSVHPSGCPYTWLPGQGPDDLPVAELPAAWVAAIRRPVPVPRPAPPRKGRARHLSPPPTAAGLSPAEAYNKAGDVGTLLEKHGWSKYRTVGDNDQWTRPGKARGTSATYNAELRTFYNFSTAADLEVGKPYSPFDLFAALEHGGDCRRAALDLLEQGYGERRGPPPRTDADVPWEYRQ